MNPQTIGVIASTVTVIYTAIGLPDQIRTVERKRTTDGLSWPMTCLLLTTFTAWSLYGLAKSDWFIVVPNTIGGICAFIMLCQFYRFRKKHKPEHL